MPFTMRGEAMRAMFWMVDFLRNDAKDLRKKFDDLDRLIEREELAQSIGKIARHNRNW